MKHHETIFKAKMEGYAYPSVVPSEFKSITMIKLNMPENGPKLGIPPTKQQVVE